MADVHCYRNIRYRLLPGSRATARQLFGLAGASRFVWNHFLGKNQEAYRLHREHPQQHAKPSVSFFALAKEFAAFRNGVECPWLRGYAFKVTRAPLQRLALAFQAFFRGKGHPRFKARGRDRPRFTIPDGVKIRGEHLHVPGVGELNSQGMTSSGKGTVEQPGVNVRAKAGLNRSILATGWAELEQMLSYKTRVVHVDPAYTSQTCARCGHVDRASRRSQSVFRCTSCGHRDNADLNAAENILASGIGATARREAFPSGTSTTREIGADSASLESCA